MLYQDVISLAEQLMARASITPNDKGCQPLIASWLKPLGFSIENLSFHDVSNLWARYGTEEPLFVFAGHTDVVPPGPPDAWDSPPFVPTQKAGYLYGRGSADMKASIAAMISACARVIYPPSSHPIKGSIAFLITSDEEGVAIDGTAKVIETLKSRQEKITYCLVGEPSSHTCLGDTIRVGRRGSLNGTLTIYSEQKHIAYCSPKENAIHQTLGLLDTLAHLSWSDHDDPDFPPTQFQYAYLKSGTGVTNLTPDRLTATFNLRYNPSNSAESLKKRITSVLEEQKINYSLQWQHPALPFKNKGQKLLSACQTAIRNRLGIEPKLSTGGGTSDGRFIAPMGCEIVELGPINATIHQANECIRLSDLKQLALVYESIVKLIFGEI